MLKLIDIKYSTHDKLLTKDEYSLLYNDLEIVKMYNDNYSNAKGFKITTLDDCYDDYLLSFDNSTYKQLYGYYTKTVILRFLDVDNKVNVMLHWDRKGYVVSTTRYLESNYETELRGKTTKIESTLNKFNKTIEDFILTCEQEDNKSNKQNILSNLISQKFGNKKEFYCYDSYTKYNPMWNITFNHNQKWAIEFKAQLNEFNELTFSSFKYNVTLTNLDNLLIVQTELLNNMLTQLNS